MTLQDLEKQDIFKFTDSDSVYSIFSIESNKVTIQRLHTDDTLEIEKEGNFSKYFNAEVVMIAKYGKRHTLDLGG